MALSTLLCRVPVRPLPILDLLDRFTGRKIRTPEVSTLQNGLTVITARGGVPHSYVGLFTKAGSRYEPVKGRRGVALLTNRALAERLDGNNFVVSSGVDREHAFFALEGSPASVGASIEALGQLLANPTVSRAAVDAVLPQVFNETAAFRSAKFRVAEDEVLANAFASTGLGNPVYPFHQADFGNFEAADFQKHSHLYTPENSVLVAVGDVKPADVEAAAQRAFGSIAGGEGAATFEQGRFMGGYTSVRTNEYESAVGVAFEAPPITHSDAPAFVLLPHCNGAKFDRSLGQYGGDSWEARKQLIFPFVREVRHKYLGFEDTGVYFHYIVGEVESGCNSFHQMQINIQAMDSVQRFQRAFSDEEFVRAKARALQYLTAEAGDSASAIGTEVAKSFLHHGQVITVPDVAARLAVLAKEEFQESLNRHLFHGNTLAYSIGSAGGNAYNYDGRDAEMGIYRLRD